VNKTISTTTNYEYEIFKLKLKLNAEICSSVYADSEINDISDFIGSDKQIIDYSTSSKAKILLICSSDEIANVIEHKTNKKVIALLNKDNNEDIDQYFFRDADQFKKANPESIIISLLDSNSQIKKISDFITSEDKLEEIIPSINEAKKIYLSADKNLGRFISNRAGREIYLPSLTCSVHSSFSERELIKIKTENPKYQVIASPLCIPKILQYADYIGFSEDLVKYVSQNNTKDFIVLSDARIINCLKKTSPSSNFLDVPIEDPSTKQLKSSVSDRHSEVTLKKIYSVFENLIY
jgi:quinolinate synthase